jgi:uncharacterized protein YunC (DUF1805 family)
LRNISINSNDGLFQGYVVVGISNTAALTALMKKIKDVRGVKDVTRADSVSITNNAPSNSNAKTKKK